MMVQHKDTVTYGHSGQTHFHKSTTAPQPLERTVAALRDAIVQADLWVLHEIDPQMLLARGGFDIRPARQILFFHPRYMVRILASDPAAVLEAPLKIAVIDTPDDGIMVRWPDPEAAFARYGSAPLAALGKELAQVCDGIVRTALEGGA